MSFTVHLHLHLNPKLCLWPKWSPRFTHLCVLCVKTQIRQKQNKTCSSGFLPVMCLLSLLSYFLFSSIFSLFFFAFPSEKFRCQYLFSAVCLYYNLLSLACCSVGLWGSRPAFTSTDSEAEFTWLDWNVRSSAATCRILSLISLSSASVSLVLQACSSWCAWPCWCSASSSPSWWWSCSTTARRRSDRCRCPPACWTSTARPRTTSPTAPWPPSKPSTSSAQLEVSERSRPRTGCSSRLHHQPEAKISWLHWVRMVHSKHEKTPGWSRNRLEYSHLLWKAVQ